MISMDKNYDMKDFKIISICAVIMLVTAVLTYFDKSNSTEDKVKAFRNSEILVCFDTLVVSNSNWEISGVNIYNNNSAGYIEIKNCKVKK